MIFFISWFTLNVAAVVVELSYCMEGMLRSYRSQLECHSIIQHTNMAYADAVLVCRALGGVVSDVDDVNNLDAYSKGEIPDENTNAWVANPIDQQCTKMLKDVEGHVVTHEISCTDRLDQVLCKISKYVPLIIAY